MPPLTRRPSPLELPQDEFDAFIRTRTIGGTAAGAILGLNSDRPPHQVWDDIMYGREDGPRRRVLDRGHAMEPVIANIYAEETSRGVEGDGQTRFPHRQYSFMHWTPDRLLHLSRASVLPTFIQQISPRNEKGVLEIKCLGTRTFQETKQEGLAPQYYAQLQHYLDGSGLHWGSFAIFNAEDWALHWFDVPFDERFVQAMREHLINFWNDHVLTRIRPEDASAQPLVRAPRHVGTEAVVIETTEWRQALNALATAKNEVKLAETAFELARDRVKTLMEALGHERVRVPGVGSVTWLPQSRQTLDEERLAREYPELDLAAYKRTTEFRVFNLRPERAGRS